MGNEGKVILASTPRRTKKVVKKYPQASRFCSRAYVFSLGVGTASGRLIFFACYTWYNLTAWLVHSLQNHLSLLQIFLDEMNCEKCNLCSSFDVFSLHCICYNITNITYLAWKEIPLYGPVIVEKNLFDAGEPVGFLLMPPSRPFGFCQYQIGMLLCEPYFLIWLFVAFIHVMF